MYTEVCEFLTEQPMEIINVKKMKLLTKEQQESQENPKMCYIRKENFDDKYAKDRKYCKVIDHCHYTRKYRSAVHSICNLKHSVPKEIPKVSHNGSNYDYHFIIRELAEELEGNLLVQEKIL